MRKVDQAEASSTAILDNNAIVKVVDFPLLQSVSVQQEQYAFGGGLTPNQLTGEGCWYVFADLGSCGGEKRKVAMLDMQERRNRLECTEYAGEGERCKKERVCDVQRCWNEEVVSTCFLKIGGWSLVRSNWCCFLCKPKFLV